MPTTDDSPTAAGATNVFLTQRAATAPYRREEVSIQGDENPMKALGFDSGGILRTLSVAQMIEDDPEAAQAALGVSEDPFVSVDTEAEFDAALAAGRSMVLRGEGTGGVISLTGPKSVAARFTTIKSDIGAVLNFTTALQGVAVNLRRGITIHADDVTLNNFELTSAHTDLATNNCYGLAFSEGTENHGHRLKVLDMLIHNWQRCISKDGSVTTSSHDDCHIERSFCHSAKEYVCYLNFGFNRFHVRDSRFLGWLDGATQVTTDNAMYGGSNWDDCLFDSCHFGNVKRMGFEATPADITLYTHRRTHLHWCRAENWSSMGFSIGYVTGGIYEKCKAINVKQCGFEIAGRVAGNPAQPVGRASDFAQAIVESCEVDGVTHTGPAYGISLDGARDTSIRGACTISNVSSTFETNPGDNDGACGVGLTDCERCSVQLVVFNDAGHKHIYCDAKYLPHTTGFHDFSNNTFRNRNSAAAFVQYALWIRNQSCSVRQNLAYQKTGTSLLYLASTASTASLVCADGVPCSVGTVLFGGAPPATNLILNG